MNYFKLSIIALFLFQTISAQQAYKYKNPKLSSEERTVDLISHMTLEEKVGQLLCPLGWEMYERNGNQVTHSKKFEEYVQQRHIGMLWATFRADPWTKKTLENGLNPKLAAKAGNALQRYIMENTRLGIPVFLAEECPHGHMAIGTTVFPTAIGQAATWNPSLIQQMSAVISKEARSQGSHIGYGPVLDLAREARWSRVEETYGEDPVLISKMGEAFVKGFGSGDLSKPYSLISTLKHFVAYGIPDGGHNGNSNSVGMRDLKENYLPPFEKAVKAGALSVMTAYNSVDGIPCTSNEYLLKDVLCKDWGFKGFTVSDLGSIEGLKGSHYVVSTIQEAAILSLTSGLDCDLGGNAFFTLSDAVKKGMISETQIDSAVYKILKLKFDMRLFENPYVDENNARQVVRTQENMALARQVARESIVLLENKNNVLPLNKSKIKKIAVIGPNADNVYNQLGDYTAPQDDSNVKTVLDGIRSKLKQSQIEYVKGCAIRDTLNTDIDKAVQAALRSDVAVVVVGGSSARDFKTKYIETGAAVADEHSISDMESGEGFDRVSLDLMGKQLELLKAIKATGKPVVVVYIQGRPLNMNWASENADALLSAWYPGQEGGNAIADVLFGEYNPAGRLPMSVAKSVGQLPVYYNHRNPASHDYVEMTSKPLYSFGYGLSFTSFEYSNLKISKINSGVEVTVELRNSGNFDGDEVVQLYLRNNRASVVQPIMQLKAFERVNLKKGETKTIKLLLTKDDFSIIDKKMNRVVEPNGDFTFMVGSASDNIKLQEKMMLNL